MANTTARCVKRVLKGWREQGCGIRCRPGARKPWRVSGNAQRKVLARPQGVALRKNHGAITSGGDG